MRQSLVRSTVLVAFFAVLALAIPILFVFRDIIHQEAINRLQQEAETVAVGFSDELLAGAPITEAELDKVLPGDDRMTLRLANGRELTAGPRSPFPSELRVTVEGPEGSTLIVAVSGEGAQRRMRTTLILVSLTGSVVLLTAGILAWWQARRLTRPLQRVVASTDLMVGGELASELPHSGMPEVDAIADALKRLSDRVRELVRTEREFSSNASHQLRSGLTSLRLRLETLIQVPSEDVPREASAALTQAEKLSETVEGLLHLARTGRAGEALRYDLERVVRRQVARIEPLVLGAGRLIRVESTGSTEVVGSPMAVGEALDILLSNALKHGAGTIELTISTDDGMRLVEVADGGPGIADDVLPTLFERRLDPEGHGIGLALARALVEGEGGRLEMHRSHPPTFRLLLPGPSSAA